LINISPRYGHEYGVLFFNHSVYEKLPIMHVHCRWLCVIEWIINKLIY